MSIRKRRTRGKRLLKVSQVEALLVLLMTMQRRIRAKGPMARTHWPVKELAAKGLSPAALEWLLKTGCLAVVRAKARKEQAAVRGRPPGSENGEGSPAVRGTAKLRRMLRVIREIALYEERAAIDGGAGANGNGRAPAIVPYYDPVARELWLGSLLVKRLRGRAFNQERVLAALQDAGWPHCLLDPLPYTPIEPQQRLHDTVRRLNRAQSNCLIQFERDGTGQGVRWELVGKARPQEC